ncbi:hypothetical protein OESDEN_07134 [Oesophagostomum dentatum]|uniref:Uncharacterized protein n=1 Tax=Oesophagostomum dentatum TaxID=61180 RepID=A0A0B1T5V3_OESDE|nr:hypothetical protein OESDEN_07134 [Oesophagostomum dentatum]
MVQPLTALNHANEYDMGDRYKQINKITETMYATSADSNTNTTENESLKKTISNLETSNAILQETIRKWNENDETVRAELEKKYGQHAELVGTLQEKQSALAEAETELVVLRRKVASMEKELKELPFLKEIRELQEKYKCVSERAEESERALEELGGHLSESKLENVGVGGRTASIV